MYSPKKTQVVDLLLGKGPVGNKYKETTDIIGKKASYVPEMGRLGDVVSGGMGKLVEVIQ
jgi:L-serine deaminase